MPFVQQPGLGPGCVLVLGPEVASALSGWRLRDGHGRRIEGTTAALDLNLALRGSRISLLCRAGPSRPWGLCARRRATKPRRYSSCPSQTIAGLGGELPGEF